MGLYPSPPGITSGKMQEKRDADEIYWVVKHGIKMSGMPAFGPTHDEKALWGLVALVEEMPQMSPENYQRMAESMDSGGHEGHTRSHKTPEGENDLNQDREENTEESEAEHSH